ncbi:uncharacterized protein LOC113317832 isoform X1 [Papaver somniferum]|uniref:uncharacterized protein LOC113317832 isoform X1 n=1 Tax=Papaver somniferum TaxID=3469 RepID=UPI000E6FE18E|nr:uncharacterized protein LOC113317832 isoform X1 [Papaver somniferum]XP_026421741.1 uncharacterized protein LOC113317832 isoform X1 [Papaver somniferum]
MGNGWKQIITIINQLSPIQEVSIQKPQSSPSSVHFPNPPSVWNKPKLETEVLPIEKENWNHTVVLSSDANMVSWDLIGKHLGKCLEKNEVFFLQPFSNSKALFKVPNSEMRTELLSKSGWSFNGFNFKFSPWTSKLNVLSEKEVLKIQSCWIEVGGIPFSLWNQKTFETIGSKCGGLLEVSEDTRNGWNLSLMELKVRGPVDNVQKIVEVNFKSLPFRASIEKAKDQSSNINNGLQCIKVFNPVSGAGSLDGGVSLDPVISAGKDDKPVPDGSAYTGKQQHQSGADK